MASERFKEVHKLTAEFEGGWSNHPSDPGGKTMYGVTEYVYHSWLKSKGLAKKPVRQITIKEAEEIYYQNYWLAAKCHRLNRGVDRMVYDAAVNSGVGRSRSWLMDAVGGSDENTVKELHRIRLSFLKRLKTWKTFGRGWERRVNAMRDTALKEVGKAPQKAPESVSEIPDKSPVETPKPSTGGIFGILAGILAKLFGRKQA